MRAPIGLAAGFRGTLFTSPWKPIYVLLAAGWACGKLAVGDLRPQIAFAPTNPRGFGLILYSDEDYSLLRSIPVDPLCAVCGGEGKGPASWQRLRQAVGFSVADKTGEFV